VRDGAQRPELADPFGEALNALGVGDVERDGQDAAAGASRASASRRSRSTTTSLSTMGASSCAHARPIPRPTPVTSPTVAPLIARLPVFPVT
jgi:hypothetical protein